MNIKNISLTHRQAVILLALVISARATSFMFSKLCLVTMSAYSLIAFRFSGAAVLLFVFFHKKIISQVNLRTALSGAVIGSLFFFVLVCEHTGLKTTNASTASFIENLAIVIVPLLECVILKKLPGFKVMLCALLAIMGVGLLTFKGNHFALTEGELFVFGAACLYAAAIIVTSHLAKKGDPFVIGFFQVLTTGILAWGATAVSGEFTLPSDTSQCLMILILAVVCTSFGFTLQPVAQSKLTAETAGAFCALGPLVASAMSVIFLKESFSASSLCGAFFILLSLSIESGLIKISRVPSVKRT